MCVLELPHFPPLYSNSVHRCDQSSTLFQTTQPQLHPYFHSFLMDMFFSLSFCITWRGEEETLGSPPSTTPHLGANHPKKHPHDQASPPLHRGVQCPPPLMSPTA